MGEEADSEASSNREAQAAASRTRSFAGELQLTPGEDLPAREVSFGPLVLHHHLEDPDRTGGQQAGQAGWEVLSGRCCSSTWEERDRTSAEGRSWGQAADRKSVV